jgi:hypothetical protein
MTLHYWLVFLLIQLINLPLMVIGWFVVPFDVLEGNDVPWIWENLDDTPQPSWSKWRTIRWLAFRNPVANLRHVKGVSAIGRPLFYRTWTEFGKLWYIKLGWMSNGYPACSAGAGRGY